MISVEEVGDFTISNFNPIQRAYVRDFSAAN